MKAGKMKSVCTGVEMFRKILDEGQAGDNVGILLRGIDKDKLKRGMVIADRVQLLLTLNSRQKFIS